MGDYNTAAPMEVVPPEQPDVNLLFKDKTLSQAFADIDELFRKKKITLVQKLRLNNSARTYIFKNANPKKEARLNETDKQGVTSRQEKTIVAGMMPNATIMTKKFVQNVSTALRRAEASFAYNQVDGEDITKTITTHLNTDQIPYALTGLAPSYLITGVPTSYINMRPSGFQFMSAILNNDNTKIFRDPLTETITINPFVVRHSTLSYVDKNLKRLLFKVFMVENIEQRILDNGDSFLLQQHSNLIQISCNTRLEIDEMQCNRYANGIAHAITPFTGDIIRGNYHHTTTYIPVKHLFTEDDLNNKPNLNSFQYYYRKSVFLQPMSDLLDVELLFDEFNAIRQYNCETKRNTPPDSNATLQQKFHLILPPLCRCQDPNVLVFGSGDVTSSLSKQIIMNYPNYKIYLIDPKISMELDVSIGEQEIHMKPVSLFEYEHPHHHICHIISDVGRDDTTRDFSANDYRFSNYVGHYLLKNYYHRYTKMTLKLGFAYNIPHINAHSIWHFKPQNPEFFVDLFHDSKIPIVKFLTHVLSSKLAFIQSRFKNWEKQKNLIGYSDIFPKLDVTKMIIHKPAFTLRHGLFIPYSNSTHPQRLQAHVKPVFSYFDPLLSKDQKDLLNNINKAKSLKDAEDLLENSNISPTAKIFAIASILGRSIETVGNRLKEGLGIQERTHLITEMDKELLGDNICYLSYEEKTKKITTITPSSKEIYLDINKLHNIIQNRQVYPDLLKNVRYHTPE